MRNVCKIWVENREGKRPHEGPRHRWEDDIRMNRREKGWDVVD